MTGRTRSPRDVRVLVLLPTARDAVRTQTFLGRAGIGAQACRDIADLAGEVAAGAGAVLLTEEALSGSKNPLQAALSRQPQGFRVPLVVLSRQTARTRDVLTEEGWSGTLVERPVRARTLVSVVRATLRARRNQYEVRDALLERELHSATLREKDARQAEQLLILDRQKDEFLATLAHELRNPLAPIRTGLSILERTRDQPTFERTREMMDRQLGHMVRLIDDLMDLSRITRGKVDLRKERVSLSSVIDAAEESSRPHMERAMQQLSISVPEEAIYFDVDPTRMVQVVGNLLNNAAKYTAHRGHIALRAWAEGRDVMIEVTDDGAGIPKEQLGAVFEMFSQVNRTLERAQGGLGIGLAVVRKLLEMHGGTITAKSKGMGMGSTFTVRLPDARKMEKAMINETEPLAPHSPKRILVVDDNRDAAECLSMLLEFYGHSTQMAHTGPDAIATAMEFHPEVVFLDIGLPGMDGYDVARRLRDDPELSTSTLVAVTGWGSEDDRRRASEAGFDFHLTKPVESRTVETLLSRAGSH